MIVAKCSNRAAEIRSLGSGIFQQYRDFRWPFGKKTAKGSRDPLQPGRFALPQVGAGVHDKEGDAERAAALHLIGEGGDRLLPEDDRPAPLD